MVTGIFFVSSGAEIRPLSQWDLGDFFPNLKKIPNLKKKKYFFDDDDNLLESFNLMAIVCVIANLFLN